MVEEQGTPDTPGHLRKILTAVWMKETEDLEPGSHHTFPLTHKWRKIEFKGIRIRNHIQSRSQTRQINQSTFVSAKVTTMILMNVTT